MMGIKLTYFSTRWQKTTKQATSLADLKLAVRLPGDESPSISGLRSVCWKVRRSTSKIRSILTSVSGFPALPKYRLIHVVGYKQGLEGRLQVSEKSFFEVY